MTELAVVANRRLLGTVTRSPGGGLSFAYEAAWRRDPDAFPLSLSMPLRADPFPRAAVEPWLAGLLPDDEDVLRAWGVRFQVSRRNVFGLLGEVGEDCAGAVQFVRPERLDRVLGSAPPPVQWLTTDEVGRRLADIRFDPALSRRPEDPGRFSLPGVQPKTALLFDEGRWGLPAGATPTTHILKPESRRFPGLSRERVSLPAARARRWPPRRDEPDGAFRRSARAGHNPLRPPQTRIRLGPPPSGGLLPGPRTAAGAEIRKRRRPDGARDGGPPPRGVNEARRGCPQPDARADVELDTRRHRFPREELLAVDRPRRADPAGAALRHREFPSLCRGSAEAQTLEPDRREVPRLPTSAAASGSASAPRTISRGTRWQRAASWRAASWTLCPPWSPRPRTARATAG